MPRFARIHVTGGLIHVVSRFHDHRFYLDIEGARQKYLELLGRATETHDCRIIAYCLMSSHVHIVVQLGNDSVGSLTKKVHSPFGRWVNAHRQGKGIGTILADRPKTVFVHSETYGVDLIRYVHNNPVRAGLVERAEDSDWSSHRSYLGLAETPPWLATDTLLGETPKLQSKARKDFAAYVAAGCEEKRRPEFSGEVSKALGKRMHRLLMGDVELSYPVLGPDSFVASVLKQPSRGHRDNNNRRKYVSVENPVPQLIEGVFAALGLDRDLARKRVRTAAVARGRALVAWIWVEIMARPQVVVAEGLNVRPASVSRMISKLRRTGLTRADEEIVASVLDMVTSDENTETKSKARLETEHQQDMEPRVLVLKRKR